ncbi:MAG: tetratricopeptide repeat protein [Candidatus Thorarchaeota archaeon]
MNQVEKLVNQEKYEEVLKQIPKDESLDESSQLIILYFKSTCFLNLGELIKAKKTSLKLLNISKKTQNLFFTLDAICFLLKISTMLETSDEGKNLIYEGETILNQKFDGESRNYIQKKAAFLFLKATSLDPNTESIKYLSLMQESLSLRKSIEDKTGISESLYGLGNYYLYKGDHKLAHQFFTESLSVGEETGNKFLISQANRALGNVFLSRGKFKHALEYTQKALALVEKIKNKCEISHNLQHLAQIFYFKGELEEAERYIIKSLALAESAEYTVMIILCLYDYGRLLQDRGNFNASLECFQKAITLVKKRNAKFFLAEGLYHLIRLYTYNLSPSDAYPLIKELNVLRKEKVNFWNELIYQAGKALVLKTSKRLPDKMEALRIFQKIAKENQTVHKITVEAIINLCDLLLFELKTTGNEEVISELEQYSNQLLKIATEQNSHSLLAETYWLLSKLALLKLDIHQAQALLLKAQSIAEKRGLKTLANSIGYDHYSFFSQLQKWEEYIDWNVSLNQRIELAQLEELVVKMIHKQPYDVPGKTIEELMKIEEFRTYLKEVKRILYEYEEE